MNKKFLMLMVMGILLLSFASALFPNGNFNAPNGNGIPTFINLNKVFRFPLFPGPWIMQGRRIINLVPFLCNF